MRSPPPPETARRAASRAPDGGRLRGDRPLHTCSSRAFRASARSPWAVLHAGSAREAAAAAVQPLHRPGRRARLPRRAARGGDDCDRLTRGRRPDPRHGPARPRLRPRRRAAASRRRRDRRRSLPVPLGAPRRAPALLGFRTAAHAEAAALVPNATVVVDPVLVTDALPAEPGDVLACGPEPMLDALALLVPGAQLAREAPMACGYGACYGCVVERGGSYVRLCLEGPVVRGGTHGSPTSPLLHAAASQCGTGAPAGQSPAPPADGFCSNSASRTRPLQ